MLLIILEVKSRNLEAAEESLFGEAAAAAEAVAKVEALLNNRKLNGLALEMAPEIVPIPLQLQNMICSL